MIVRGYNVVERVYFTSKRQFFILYTSFVDQASIFSLKLCQTLTDTILSSLILVLYID